MHYWGERLRSTYAWDDLSYISKDYAPVSTNLNTGEKTNLESIINEQRSLVKRWTQRRLELIDYAYCNRRVEYRFRYTCTNSKGKTVSGYCKSTLIISATGQIEAYADDSSTKKIPDFSIEVGPPISAL